MAEFKDSKGEVWTIDLPFGELKRIEKASEGRFCLIDPIKDNLAERLVTDLLQFYDLLQIICEPQAEARGINAEQFGLLMAADCLFAAQKAFVEAWTDFFHRLRRVDQARGVELMMQQAEKALELIEAETKRREPLAAKIIGQFENQVKEALGKEFGETQERMESQSATSTSSTG